MDRDDANYHPRLPRRVQFLYVYAESLRTDSFHSADARQALGYETFILGVCPTAEEKYTLRDEFGTCEGTPPNRIDSALRLKQFQGREVGIGRGHDQSANISPQRKTPKTKI